MQLRTIKAVKEEIMFLFALMMIAESIFIITSARFIYQCLYSNNNIPYKGIANFQIPVTIYLFSGNIYLDEPQISGVKILVKMLFLEILRIR